MIQENLHRKATQGYLKMLAYAKLHFKNRIELYALFINEKNEIAL